MTALHRYRQVTGCRRCWKEAGGVGECCPDCGGTFLQGYIVHDFVIREVWKPVKVKWWKPSTWNGGYWEKESK